MTRLYPNFVCSDVRVRNLARAVQFYRSLGLKIVAKSTMEDGTTLVWLHDRRTRQLLELFHLSRRSPLYVPFRISDKPRNALIFTIPDVKEMLPKLRRVGGRVLTDFTDGTVRLTFVRDPDGTLLEFVSWAKKAKIRRGSPMLSLALDS